MHNWQGTSHEIKYHDSGQVHVTLKDKISSGDTVDRLVQDLSDFRRVHLESGATHLRVLYEMAVGQTDPSLMDMQWFAFDGASECAVVCKRPVVAAMAKKLLDRKSTRSHRGRTHVRFFHTADKARDWLSRCTDTATGCQ